MKISLLKTEIAIAKTVLMSTMRNLIYRLNQYECSETIAEPDYLLAYSIVFF